MREWTVKIAVSNRQIDVESGMIPTKSPFISSPLFINITDCNTKLLDMMSINKKLGHHSHSHRNNMQRMPQNDDTCTFILLNLNLYYLHFYFCQCGYNQI